MQIDAAYPPIHVPSISVLSPETRDDKDGHFAGFQLGTEVQNHGRAEGATLAGVCGTVVDHSQSANQRFPIPQGWGLSPPVHAGQKRHREKQ
jgi:hypothetical protein